MIPVQPKNGLTITDLPIRGSDVGDTQKIFGGVTRRIFRCYARRWFPGGRTYLHDCGLISVWWQEGSDDGTWACNDWKRSCCGGRCKGYFQMYM